MNANDANNGIDQAATDAADEETSLPASQSTTADSKIIIGDEESVEFVYNNEDQEVPRDATKVITITYIKKKAFRMLLRLREVDMTASLALKTIEDGAFIRCYALALVKWPPNLKTIEENAFQECTSLKEADLSKLHGLETIGEGAFSECSALALVKWPPNLKTIEENAFQECTSLKEADMSSLHALETIGDGAFKRCYALDLVKWPPNLKTIEKYAFRMFTSLREADMSSLQALETIGEGAFQGCSALALVKWPPNVKTIGRRTFQECTSLQDVMIPSSHHWLVRKLPFDDTMLQSVDMQGHDLKKAIRIKNLYPQATPRLSMNRLVSMYAKSPFADIQLENAAQSDASVAQYWGEQA